MLLLTGSSSSRRTLSADTHISTALPYQQLSGAVTTLQRSAPVYCRARLNTSAATAADKLVRASLSSTSTRVGTAAPSKCQTVPSAPGPSPPSPPATHRPPAAPAPGPVAKSTLRASASPWTSRPRSELDHQPGTNFGLVSPAPQPPAPYGYFDSKENTSTAHVATLDLTLADQGPSRATEVEGRYRCAGPKGDPGPAGPVGAEPPVPRATVTATGATGARGLIWCHRSHGRIGLAGGQQLRTQHDRSAGRQPRLSLCQCPAGKVVIVCGCGHRDFNTAAVDIIINYSGLNPSNPSTQWRCILDNKPLTVAPRSGPICVGQLGHGTHTQEHRRFDRPMKAWEQPGRWGPGGVSVGNALERGRSSPEAPAGRDDDQDFGSLLVVQHGEESAGAGGDPPPCA